MDNIPTSGFWSQISGLINNNFNRAKESQQICQVSITYPSPEFTVSLTGTGNTDLNPAIYGSSFVTLINGYNLHLNKSDVFNVRADGRVEVLAAGTINLTSYFDMKHSANGSTLGMVYAINRGADPTIFSARAVHARFPSSSDIGHLAAVGIYQAQAGDILGVAVASDNSGTVSVRTSSLVFEYKGDFY